MKNSNRIGNVHSIETFGAFDGPGVRFVIFLQGCPFKCKYCHNRDTWSTKKNKLMTAEELLEQFDRYKAFYKQGGITVSGGEPMMQLDFLIDLFTKAKQKNIHTCLDTSAACFIPSNTERFDQLLGVTDLFLLDIKHMDDKKHRRLTGKSNQDVLKFMQYLEINQKQVVIRHVLIPTVNDDVESLMKLNAFLKQFHYITAIDILGYHTKGIVKWESMGLTYPLKGIREATKEDVLKAEMIVKKDIKYYK